MAEPRARFRVVPDVATREIDGGLLLVNLQSGATWKLNQVGAAVARALDGGADVEAVVAAIERQFADRPETLRQEVEALLEDLRRQALVEPIA